METGTNPLHPKVVSSPVVRLYEEDAIRLGKDKFPYVGTTYRLTEHFHTDQACVAQFHRAAGTVCRNQRRAGESKGIANGDWVKVSSKRGFIRAVAVVTSPTAHAERQRPAGGPSGSLLHWGFEGVARKATSPTP